MPCSLSLVSAVMLDVVFSMPQNIMLQGPSVGNINIALTTNKSIASISFIKIESHAYFESRTLLSNHFQNVEYLQNFGNEFKEVYDFQNQSVTPS